MPMITFGWFLNMPMNLCLSFLGIDEYNDSPLSAVRLINTLPTLL